MPAPGSTEEREIGQMAVWSLSTAKRGNGVEQLRDAGRRLLVATSKPTTFAVGILEHFGLDGHFDAIFGAHLDGRLGHKEELIAHVREQVDFSVADAAFVGDRRFDMQGARAHGIRAVGALWGYGSREELETAGADHLARTPADVASAVGA